MNAVLQSSMRDDHEARQEKAQEIEVIDITPVKKDRAPIWFYALVIAISLTCAVTVFLNLDRGGAEVQHYVPAHSDASGNIVPGDWKSEP